MTPDIAALTSQPWFWPVAAVAALFVIRASWPLWRSRVRGSKDKRRMYTTDERMMGFARSGDQCEYDRWWLWRCTRSAQHGDHFFPWSKGGATSMRNFVAACPRCNCSKGARVPTFLERARIESRRRRYFPHAVPVEAGEWYRGGIR